jgi:hypothetical protein
MEFQLANCFSSYHHILYILKPNAYKMAQNNEKRILYMCLRIQCCIHQRFFGILHFLKKGLNHCTPMDMYNPQISHIVSSKVKLSFI